MNITKLQTLSLIAGLTTSVAITSSAWAGAISPDDLIRTTAQFVLNSFKNDKNFTKDSVKTTKLIEDKVLPNFDFARMTRLAIGSHWSKATPEQRKELTNEFKTLLIRTYSNSLSKYKDHKVEVESAKIVGDDATVKSIIIQPNGKSIPVDYTLAKSENTWKVYDIVIENLSLVMNYRNQFSSIVRVKGIDGLIQSLKIKIMEQIVQQNNRTLNIEVRSTNVFLLQGVLNFDSILILDKRIQQLDAQNNLITLDLSEISQLDSSLISYLLECRRKKNRIQLMNIPQSLTSLINLYGLKDFFNLTDSHTLIAI